ncbi:MAG: phospholipase D family protein [Rhodobacteraceae bacterium]|nr:phospholipase D family protein [Paracoccaceae bacterium]
MKTLAAEIVALLERARQDVLIVAPFIRSEALRGLLESIPAGVDTTIVTRWRIADLVAGASDLGVYDLTEANNVQLYLRSDLHAKLFAADDRCLVGSSNITAAALGLRSYSNLELLVPVSRSEKDIVEFERELLGEVIQATLAHRDRMNDLLNRIDRSKVALSDLEDVAVSAMAPKWIPTARNPEDLFSVYQGSADVGSATKEILEKELREIGVVGGLCEDDFKAWVSAKICQSSFVGSVLQRIEDRGSVTEADVSEFVTQVSGIPNAHEPRELLEVAQRWLTWFLGVRYETASETVKLIKARDL